MDYLLQFLTHTQSSFLFTSLDFWLFLSVALAGFSLCYKRPQTRNTFLLACSFFFYYKTGGYFIIDELEDNLNKTIVMNIIEFFMRKSTNPFNAHLVFTTHYQEIVDILPRNDSVYIAARNNDMLTIKNLAAFLKRKDTRRSELLFSDYYDLGTAIDYSAYNALRKGIENLAKKEMEETR